MYLRRVSEQPIQKGLKRPTQRWPGFNAGNWYSFHEQRHRQQAVHAQVPGGGEFFINFFKNNQNKIEIVISAGRKTHKKGVI